MTAEAGLDTVGGEPWFYTHGAAVADYDNDGWPDLLVTGYGRLALFRNDRGRADGRPRFRDVTKQAGLLGDHFWATSAAFADLDGDGRPDLYVCQYVDWSFANHPKCPGYYGRHRARRLPPAAVRGPAARPLPQQRQRHVHRRRARTPGCTHRGRDEDYARLGHLAPAALERLRRADADRDFGKGLGVLVVDVNGDGRPGDLRRQRHDGQVPLPEPQHARGHPVRGRRRLRRGRPGTTGAPRTGAWGWTRRTTTAAACASLLVTNYQNELPALYRNTSTRPGQPRFTYQTAAAGLAAVGRQYVGFGTALPRRGQRRLGGHRDRQRPRDPPPDDVRPSGRSRSSSATAGGRTEAARSGSRTRRRGAGATSSPPHQGRGLAVGDLDNDGRPDLVVSHVNEPVTLLRNEAGETSHWLGVRLVGQGRPGCRRGEARSGIRRQDADPLRQERRQLPFVRRPADHLRPRRLAREVPDVDRLARGTGRALGWPRTRIVLPGHARRTPHSRGRGRQVTGIG